MSNFSKKSLSKQIKRKEKRINKLYKDNMDYQLEHECLLKTIRDLREQLIEAEDRIFDLETDLKLATKKKVEYRNLLQQNGIDVKSVFHTADQSKNGKHTQSTLINALVNNTKKNQKFQ